MNNQKEIPSEIVNLFELYNSAIKHKDLYREDNDHSAVKMIILKYYENVVPDYDTMIYNFRQKYISNESLIENNITPYEKKGISYIYDFIQQFNIQTDYFNIFVTGLILHQKLYKAADDARQDIKARNAEFKKIEALEQKVKETGDLALFNQLQEMKKTLSVTENFGGRLRNSSAIMADTKVRVPDPKEATFFFQNYVTPEKSKEYEDHLRDDSIFDYIDYCVKTTVNLIKYQPFNDGNKRVFRNLLNLMFKKRNIPPIFIKPNERGEYKKALLLALENKDYSKIIIFYYYKICDSIYELEIKPYQDYQKENGIAKTNK